MNYQTCQQRRVRSVTHMPMKTDRLCDKESSKRVAILIANVMNVMLKLSRVLAQNLPVLRNSDINVFRYRVLAS